MQKNFPGSIHFYIKIWYKIFVDLFCPSSHNSIHCNLQYIKKKNGFDVCFNFSVIPSAILKLGIYIRTWVLARFAQGKVTIAFAFCDDLYTVLFSSFPSFDRRFSSYFVSCAQGEETQSGRTRKQDHSAMRSRRWRAHIAE